jgi:hypothetical protein
VVDGSGRCHPVAVAPVVLAGLVTWRCRFLFGEPLRKQRGLTFARTSGIFEQLLQFGYPGVTGSKGLSQPLDGLAKGSDLGCQRCNCSGDITRRRIARRNSQRHARPSGMGWTPLSKYLWPRSMTTPEQITGLVAAAKKRHDDVRRRAVTALRGLDSSGAPVNIRSVAIAVGVSRSWLYRQVDLRATIEQLRQTRPAPSRPARPSAERATTDSLRQQIDALHTLHAQLTAENQQLREALARQLGQRRADPLLTGDPTNVEDMSTTSKP